MQVFVFPDGQVDFSSRNPSFEMKPDMLDWPVVCEDLHGIRDSTRNEEAQALPRLLRALAELPDTGLIVRVGLVVDSRQQQLYLPGHLWSWLEIWYRPDPSMSDRWQGLFSTADEKRGGWPTASIFEYAAGFGPEGRHDRTYSSADTPAKQAVRRWSAEQWAQFFPLILRQNAEDIRSDLEQRLAVINAFLKMA